jgi:hypothetical protein
MSTRYLAGALIVAACHGADTGKSAPTETGATSAHTDEPTDTEPTVPLDTAPPTYSDCSAPLEMTEVAVWQIPELRDEPVESYTASFNKLGPGLAVADLNHDGWLDAVMSDLATNAHVFLNDGAGNLVPQPDFPAFSPDGTPSELPANTNAVAAADLDGDGWVDFVFPRGQNLNAVVMYGTDGTSFVVGAQLPNTSGFAKHVSIADADADGDLDIFIGGFAKNPGALETELGYVYGDPSSLLINQGFRNFTNETEARLPPEALNGLTYEGGWIDVEPDGDMDLYLTNDWGNIGPDNALLINDGHGYFTFDADCFCNWAILGMGVSQADYDGDGDQDMFLTDWGVNHMMLNWGDGTFLDGSAAMNALPDDQAEGNRGPSWGSVPIDMDLDGWEDVLVSYGPGRGGLTSTDLALRNNGGERFEELSAQLGFDSDLSSRAIVAGDFDRDGHPDVLQTQEWQVRHFRITGGCDTGLTIPLRGPLQNQSGHGAKVEIELWDDRTLTRWVAPDGSWSSSAAELYVGLGGASRAERVLVTWPDGQTSEVLQPLAGSTLEIAHPDRGEARGR